MSRNRCSQCGEEGHNRRNRGCRMNLEQAQAQAQAQSEAEVEAEAEAPILTPESESESEPVVNLFHTYSKRATDNFAGLVKFMNNREQYRQEGLTAGNFLLGCITIVRLICDDMSLAVDHDDAVLTHIVSNSEFFYQLENQVQIINEMIQTLNPISMIRVLVSLTETGRFKMKVLDTAEKKRTSAYWKEISLVLRDVNPDSNCECPLCFDQLPSQEVISTGCNHTYCGTCVKNLATSIKDKTVKPSCSLCRAEITQLSFGKVEFRDEISEHFYNL